MSASLKTINLLLGNLESGAFHDEASKALTKVIGDLTDHKASHGGKPSGEITIKLKFVLEDKFMDVKPELTVKVPKVSRSRSVYFVTPENGLSRSDPAQHEMDIATERFTNKPNQYTGARVPATA